eukprot:SAG31_NODE_1094_length_9945_cov_3.834349_13_plen_49_part_00
MHKIFDGVKAQNKKKGKKKKKEKYHDQILASVDGWILPGDAANIHYES